MFIFEPVSYGIAYNPAGGNEPDAAAEGWTLTGTDHASVSSDKLVITGGGADATNYYEALETITATGIVFAKAEVQLSSTVTDAWITIQSATLGVELPLQLSARSVDHSTDTAAVDLTTQERTVTVLLGANGYVVLVDGAEVMEGTPTTYAGANEIVLFGKGTTNDGGTQTWGVVQCSTAETYTFAYPPNGWNVDVYTTEKHVNIAQDGTIDTIHYRDDNDITFRSVAHTDAEVTSLSTYYETYMAPGRVFFLAPDYTDVSTLYSVKMLGKKFSPVASAATPLRRDISWTLRISDDAEPIVLFEEEMEDMLTLEVNSATPSIAGSSSWISANTSATTITNWIDARSGKVISVVINDAYTTISSTLTKTGMTIVCVAGDTLQFMYTGSAWKQIGGSVGMGRWVPLTDPDAIGDWIAANVTTYTDVDVSDDGVRKGANAVCCRFYTVKSGGTWAALRTRRNGSSDTLFQNYGPYVTPASSDDFFGNFRIPLDSNGVFEASWSASWATSTTNSAWVIGYYI
jgi:hypothetical protein